MHLKVVKSLLLLALFCSAVFAVTIISASFYGAQVTTGDCTKYMCSENTATFMYGGDFDGEYTLCGGDSVPGGHP